MALSENGLNMGKVVSSEAVAKQAVYFLEHDSSSNVAVFDPNQGKLVTHEHTAEPKFNIDPIVNFLEKKSGPQDEVLILDAASLREAEVRTNFQSQRPSDRRPLSHLRAIVSGLTLIGGI